jgi:hypothetical protein
MGIVRGVSADFEAQDSVKLPSLGLPHWLLTPGQLVNSFQSEWSNIVHSSRDRTPV